MKDQRTGAVRHTSLESTGTGSRVDTELAVSRSLLRTPRDGFLDTILKSEAQPAKVLNNLLFQLV